MPGLATKMEHKSTVIRLLETRGEDPTAVARLLENYRHYLRLLAKTSLDRTLQSKADPSDVVQDAIIRAAQNFANFRGQSEGELIAWLKRILLQSMTNLARRYHAASRRVGREQSLNQILDQSSAALDAMGHVASRGAGSFPTGVTAGVIIANALAKLADDDRDVITLRNFEQLEWSQVALRMNRSSEAVRKLWGRAIVRLRPLIEESI